MSNNSLRETLLGGLPGRQASTLLFAIESRTAALAQQARQAMVLFARPESAEQRERAFLAALAEGRDPPRLPTIQELERYAPQWSALVPENPRIRAAVAHLINQKYEFTAPLVPSIRAALGLDEEAVQQAYEALYQAPLASIYRAQVKLRERWQWTLSGLESKLEALPPFWIAFISTVMGTLGSGILALPIAFAKVGPLVGVALLLILGFANVLTIGYMAEGVAESPSIRNGTAFIGQVVSDYLGQAGSLLFSLTTAAFCFVVLLSFYLGVGKTLALIMPIPAGFWIALLFLIGLYFLRKDNFASTVGAGLVINMINISLILCLTLLAFTKFELDHLMYVNLPHDISTFDSSILELVFGVVLFIFTGHISVANSARLVLQRDSSPRSLVSGSMAGMLTVMALYALWSIGMGGALDPQQLIGLSGTVLEPLAEMVGPIVYLLGTLYIVLAMGLGSIQYMLGLYHLVRERIKVHHEGSAFLLAISPLVLLFLLTEWLVLTETGSFTALISFGGVITAPLFAGLFPVLLLVASRRASASPLTYPFLAHPWLVAGIYLLFLSSLFLHGLFIWQEGWARVSALAIGLLAVGLTIAIQNHSRMSLAVLDKRKLKKRASIRWEQQREYREQKE